MFIPILEALEERTLLSHFNFFLKHDATDSMSSSRKYIDSLLKKLEKNKTLNCEIVQVQLPSLVINNLPSSHKVQKLSDALSGKLSNKIKDKAIAAWHKQTVTSRIIH